MNFTDDVKKMKKHLPGIGHYHYDINRTLDNLEK